MVAIERKSSKKACEAPQRNRASYYEQSPTLPRITDDRYPIRLRPYAMVAGVGVGSVSGGDMAGPAEQTPRTSPQTRRNGELEDTGQDATVVELPKIPGTSALKTAANAGLRIVVHYLPYMSLRDICIEQIWVRRAVWLLALALST